MSFLSRPPSFVKNLNPFLLNGRWLGRDHNGSFTRSACPYIFKNRRHEHGRCRRQTSIKHLDAFFAETLQQSF